MRDVSLPDHPLLAIAVVEARVRMSPADSTLLAVLAGTARPPSALDTSTESRAPIYQAARNLLRHTGYKPSGRNKPASEYLNKVVEQRGSLTSINNVVDVNNIVSLYSGLPISVFDADRLTGPLRIAPGAAGESYVFNAAGQELALDGLLTVYHRPADAWIPAGNAVKDSMATKVHESTESILAVVYSNRCDVERAHLEAAATWYAQLLRGSCGAGEVEIQYLP